MSAPLPDAALGAEICGAIRLQAGKLGLDIGHEPDWDKVSFATQSDPYSGETSLVGTWKGGSRYGSVTFFADGRLFAEYQVLLPHPALPGQYVEAVQVWGRPGQFKGDAVVVAWNQE